MSLADELRADLDDEDDEMLSQEINQKTDMSNGFKVPLLPEVSATPSTGISGQGPKLDSVAKLHTSQSYTTVMAKIDKYSARDASEYDTSCPCDINPEYHLIVDANNLVADIDDEVIRIYKHTKEVYSKRFPELETLVVEPVDYLRTANELGNTVLRAKNNAVLEQFLTQATIMVVSVTASTTQGQELSDEEIATVSKAFNLVMSLLESKAKILLYVESRMSYVAPNLSTIVGSNIAAQLLGAAGGLSALCTMPSSHLSLLGQDKRSVEGGFTLHKSAANSIPHCGYIYQCQIVQSVPVDLRRKVARFVGDKCMLAARIDLQQSSSTDNQTTVGQDLRLQLEKKIDKLLEPPVVKSVRALAVPLEAPRKRRGGRRVRRQKERFAVTELRRQANRMNFAEIEEDVVQNDLGFSRGNIGKGGTAGGSLRAIQVDERTKVRVSQTLKRNMQKQQAMWGGSTSVRKQISGTASSVAFTPLQGLEIVNPNAAEATSEATKGNKYFSSSASFAKVS